MWANWVFLLACVDYPLSRASGKSVHQCTCFQIHGGFFLYMLGCITLGWVLSKPEIYWPLHFLCEKKNKKKSEGIHPAGATHGSQPSHLSVHPGVLVADSQQAKVLTSHHRQGEMLQSAEPGLGQWDEFTGIWIWLRSLLWLQQLFSLPPGSAVWKHPVKRYQVPKTTSLFYKSCIFNTMLNLRLLFINLPLFSTGNSYFYIIFSLLKL